MSLEPRWWENARFLNFSSPKSRGLTLTGLSEKLDELGEWGFNAICMRSPYHGGVQYSGLDVIDYYTVDPALGTLDDFDELIYESHKRDIAVISFLNLGYAAVSFPPFVTACDDVKAGVDSPESRWFVWSDTKSAELDRSHMPFFLNDTEGSWRFNERVGKYVWVRWPGDVSQEDMPQFNFGKVAWQEECRRVVRFWMERGIDGMMVDAVPDYTNCTFEINNSTITDVVHEFPNTFVLPEGAGIRNDPVPWITEGHYDGVIDYGIATGRRWEQAITIALKTGNPRGIEIKLRLYRDRVVAAGGVTWANPRLMSVTKDKLSPAQMLLEVVTLATVGELIVVHDDIFEPVWPTGFETKLREIVKAQRDYPALRATGPRRRLPTINDSLFYAFLRTPPDGKAARDQEVLVVFNFQNSYRVMEVYLDWEAQLTDIFSMERRATERTLQLSLPPYGYGIFEVDRKGSRPT